MTRYWLVAVPDEVAEDGDEHILSAAMWMAGEKSVTVTELQPFMECPGCGESWPPGERSCGCDFRKRQLIEIPS